MSRRFRSYNRFNRRRKPFEYTRAGKTLAFGGKVVWKGARFGYKAAKTGYRTGRKLYRIAKWFYRGFRNRG